MCVSTQRAYSRTGIIYNVSPRAVGILINKRVGNRFIEKRVNIRVEHIKHSQGRQVFLDRVKKNEKARIAAKEKGGEFCEPGKGKDRVLMRFLFPLVDTVHLKRVQTTPRTAHTVAAATGQNIPQTIVPVPYETTI